jgi:hypothetical protein
MASPQKTPEKLSPREIEFKRLGILPTPRENKLKKLHTRMPKLIEKAEQREQSAKEMISWYNKEIKEAQEQLTLFKNFQQEHPRVEPPLTQQQLEYRLQFQDNTNQATLKRKAEQEADSPPTTGGKKPKVKQGVGLSPTTGGNYALATPPSARGGGISGKFGNNPKDHTDEEVNAWIEKHLGDTLTPDKLKAAKHMPIGPKPSCNRPWRTDQVTDAIKTAEKNEDYPELALQLNRIQDAMKEAIKTDQVCLDSAFKHDLSQELPERARILWLAAVHFSQ